MYLDQNLKYLREKAGETQQDIADLLKISQRAVSKYERGQIKPELENLILLSEHFKVSIDDLLKIEMKPPLLLSLIHI